MELKLLLLVLVGVAAYTGSAGAARLLLEDHNLPMVHMNVNAAAFDPKLNLAADGGSKQQLELRSEVSRSDKPRDGIESAVDLVDAAHPGRLSIIGTETTEPSFEEKHTHSKPHWSPSSGHDKNAKELVFNVLPKGPQTPSGPSHKGYAKVTEQRLFASQHNSAVGHLEEDDTQMLRSVPSPGVGH